MNGHRPGSSSFEARPAVQVHRKARTSRVNAIAFIPRMTDLVQHHRQPMQLRTAKARRLDRFHGGENIIAVDAGLAVAPQHLRSCSAYDNRSAP